ncbi:hypothetical protein [Capnocytophaga canis]|uniref:hypothetical protein n=1 Tax=Capnocytophaga canis TaxID=1848903 RepID=UPI0037CCD45C
MEQNKEKNVHFPDITATMQEKLTPEYGLKIAKAIAKEWFDGSMITSNCKFSSRKNFVRTMRKYARGEQPISIYQDLLSRQEGSLNYLNLDWRPDNKPGKYVNIVANGIDQRYYKLSIKAIDRISSQQKEKYRSQLERAMYGKDLYMLLEGMTGIDSNENQFVPENQDELDIHLNAEYKPKQIIAEELLIDYIFSINQWQHIFKSVCKDLVESGIGVVECFTDPQEGVQLRYTDPENYIHSYNKNDNAFKDKFYDAVVRSITISELMRTADFTDEQLKNIIKKYASKNGLASYANLHNININECLHFSIDVLFFAYKTSKRIAYKKRIYDNGTTKLIRKQEDFNAPSTDRFETLSKYMDTWLEGSYILGTNYIYNYKESENIVKDTLNRAQSRFITFATNIYENQLNSFLSDIIPICDQIHLTKLKLQHIIAEIKPNGASIDFDALANFAGGDKVDYKEILAIFNAKGIVFTKNITDEYGNEKRGVPVQELHNGIPANLMHLLNVLQHQNNELRDVSGINPSRDGTQPANALVGIQQAQLLASNTITSHIVDSAISLKLKVAEIISTRISDVFRFPEAEKIRKVYENAIGKFNMDILQQIGSVHLHEFGFSIEMLPTQEELQKFEENLAMAIQKGSIDEDDIFEAREMAKRSVEYAVQFLRVRKKKRQQEALAVEQQRMQIKSQSDMIASQSATQNKIALLQREAEIEILKQSKLAEIEAIKQQMLNEVNKPIRDEKNQLEVFKAQLEKASTLNLAKFKEEAKDKRQDKNNTDHSKMIQQRKKDLPPIDFTNADFDFTL